MKINSFTGNEEIKNLTWLVNGLIPNEDLVIVGAKPGIGKSFFIEQLAVSVAYGKPFMGQDVDAGNVLIIDEDTPTNTLLRRLKKFKNYYSKSDLIYNINYCSKEGLRFDDGSASDAINRIDNLKLVIIDCLVSVTGKSDIDKTSDMKGFDDFKQSIKRNNLTIVVNHHISTKKDILPMDLMTCDNPEGLIMNNTRIISTCDSLLILSSPDVDGVLKTLLIRPKGRRNTLPMQTFSATLNEDSDTMHFSYGERLELKKTITEDEKYILSTIELGEDVTVAMVLDRVAKMFVEQRTRDLLNSLLEKGYLQRLAREGKGGKLKFMRLL